MSPSCGIDLLPVARITQYLADGGDPAAIWTPAELDDCAGDASRLAGRWAAKEAVLKALRCGLATVPPTDVTVTTGQDGYPSVHLRGQAQERASALDLTTWSISISHDAGLAVAVAVAG